LKDVTGYAELSAPTSSIKAAVQAFENPDVGQSKVANASALGKKVKSKAPPPDKTTITVLNGNGVQGAAANASYLLAQRGYTAGLPPEGQAPDAPAQNSSHTKIYLKPHSTASRLAAHALQKYAAPADVLPFPRRSVLRPLDPGSMLLVVLGTTFHNE